MTDKPLHVQVAEALGSWICCTFEPPKNTMNLGDSGCWVGYNPKTMLVGERGTVPHYDTDWSATGPLIEKYEFELLPLPAEVPVYPWWRAVYGNGIEAQDRTPPLAVCRLLLALKKAGKL